MGIDSDLNKEQGDILASTAIKFMKEAGRMGFQWGASKGVNALRQKWGGKTPKGLEMKENKGLKGEAEKMEIQAIKDGNYNFTETASKHLDTRPYMNSPLTITNIMNSCKGVPDEFFKGGLNYRLPGTFNGSEGIWELGINPETNTIYHFLFKTVK